MQSNYKDVWEEVYRNKFMTMWQPSKSFVQFTGRFLKKRLTLDKYEEFFPAKDVLDLGCGNGAAVAYFAKMGYRTCGIDLSDAAIKMGQEFLAREGVQAELKTADASAIPYPDNSFDVVVSNGVLDHMDPERAIASAEEVYRVLRKPGLFFITLASTENIKYGEGKQSAKNTYLLEGDWYEAGALQHYYDREDINELFKDRFRIKDIRYDLQKKMSLDFQPLEWVGRWYLTTEKI